MGGVEEREGSGAPGSYGVVRLEALTLRPIKQTLCDWHTVRRCRARVLCCSIDCKIFDREWCRMKMEEGKP